MEHATEVQGSMDFSVALRALKAGDKVARRGWDDKGTFLCLADGSIGIGTADSEATPWAAPQTDLFATDWYFVA